MMAQIIMEYLIGFKDASLVKDHGHNPRKENINQKQETKIYREDILGEGDIMFFNLGLRTWPCYCFS